MSDTPRVNMVLGESVGPLAAAGSKDEFTAALKSTMTALIGVAKAMERELGKIDSILSRNLTPANKVKAIESVFANADAHASATKER